jgi:hypothetical protein
MTKIALNLNAFHHQTQNKFESVIAISYLWLDRNLDLVGSFLLCFSKKKKANKKLRFVVYLYLFDVVFGLAIHDFSNTLYPQPFP